MTHKEQKQTIERHFKTEYDINTTYQHDLSLFGLTRIDIIEGIPTAHRSYNMPRGEELILYRILDLVHYHQIQRLIKIKQQINADYNTASRKVKEKYSDWYSKMHIEVYKRKSKAHGKQDRD